MRNANTAKSLTSTHSGGGDAPLLPLLTVADVAQVLKVSTRTVRRLIKSGTLPCVTVGRSVRIQADDLAALTRPR